MKSLQKFGLVLTLVCGWNLALSNRPLQARGVGHGAVRGGSHFNLGISHFGLGNSHFGFGGNGYFGGNGCGGYGYGGYGSFYSGLGYGGYYGGYYGGLYGCNLSSDDRIPFYALHPPVYYSSIIPRAYGWSPFAYSPDAIVMPLEEGGPKEIINPFVPPTSAPEAHPKTKAKPSADKTAVALPPASHVIVNPYVAVRLASQGE